MGKDIQKCYESIFIKSKNDGEYSLESSEKNIDITKVIMQKEIMSLKFELQNALDDKNIMINRI